MPPSRREVSRHARRAAPPMEPHTLMRLTTVPPLPSPTKYSANAPFVASGAASQTPVSFRDQMKAFPIILLSVALAGVVVFLLFNRASQWLRATKMFGAAPVPDVYWVRFAMCIGPLGRFPVAIGACERGLVIEPIVPFSWLMPALWAPWDEIELEGPRWHWGTYEDVAIRGFRLALPAVIGDRIRGAKRGWKRFEDPR